MVRFDTYNASAHLVRQIEASQTARVTHDGGDNLLVELRSGQRISIYLIETVIPQYEIRTTLENNASTNTYTLFILWGAMFMPEHGELFIPDEWLETLITLYGDKTYAFDVFGKDIEIYPVIFERLAKSYRIHHLAHIDVTKFACELKHLTTPNELCGEWLIAHFSADYTTDSPALPAHIQDHPAWEILEIEPTKELLLVKQAYRRLARQYHPDINTSPTATLKMQALNNAYARILEELSNR